MRTLRITLLTALAVVAVAACGSSKKSSTSSTASASTTASSSAGAGKPTVVIGDKNFTEEYILGDLYAQALQAKGYKVTLKPNIGSSEITYKALQSGQIDMYPEYTGTFLTVVAGVTSPPHSAQDVYNGAQSYAHKHGFTLLAQTPFYDSDAVGVLKTFAQKNGLTSISELKKLGHSVKLGGPPTFATRSQALPGLKSTYGIKPNICAAGNRPDLQGARYRTGAGLGRVHYRPTADHRQVCGAE